MTQLSPGTRRATIPESWEVQYPEIWGRFVDPSSRRLVGMPRSQVGRARAGLEALAASGLVHIDYYFAAMELIRTAVPYDAMCVGSIDPATSMITDSGKVDLIDDGDEEFLYHEYVNDDVNQFIDMATRDEPTAILHIATGGDPSRSARYRDVVRPMLGAEHELRGIARVGGLLWGAYSIYRDADSPPFNQAEADFLARFEHVIAVGMRASVVASVASTALPRATDPPSWSTTAAATSCRPLHRPTTEWPTSGATCGAAPPCRSRRLWRPPGPDGASRGFAGGASGASGTRSTPRPSRPGMPWRTSP